MRRRRFCVLSSPLMHRVLRGFMLILPAVQLFRSLIKLCNVSGSTLPQYPASGPFIQLIFKNINVPVYTTLKGVSTGLHKVSLLHKVLSISSFHLTSSTLCPGLTNVGLVSMRKTSEFRHAFPRKPLRSAAFLSQTTTLARRTTAARWPVCEPPS